MTKRYPSDVTDKEWAILEGMNPNPGGYQRHSLPVTLRLFMADAAA